MYVQHLYGWYKSYDDIKKAIKKLYDGGYTGADISIITKNSLFRNAKTFSSKEAGKVYISGPLAPAICYQRDKDNSLVKALRSVNFFDQYESATKKN